MKPNFTKILYSIMITFCLVVQANTSFAQWIAATEFSSIISSEYIQITSTQGSVGNSNNYRGTAVNTTNDIIVAVQIMRH